MRAGAVAADLREEAQRSIEEAIARTGKTKAAIVNEALTMYGHIMREMDAQGIEHIQVGKKIITPLGMFP